MRFLFQFGEDRSCPSAAAGRKSFDELFDGLKDLT